MKRGPEMVCTRKKAVEAILLTMQMKTWQAIDKYAIKPDM